MAYSEFIGWFASLQSYENACKIIETEHLGIAAVVKYGLISMGLSMDDRLYEESLQTCFPCWLHKVVESYRHVDVRIESVFRAGALIFSLLNGPSNWLFESTLVDSALDRTTLCIRLTASIPGVVTLPQVSYVSAFLENGRQLGLSFHHLVDDESASPLVARYALNKVYLNPFCTVAPDEKLLISG
jgi:hypothetical protein